MKKLAFFFTAILAIIASYHYFLRRAEARRSSPEIVVSIKPLYGMAASLLKGITEPKLLLEGSFSPHHFQATPSMITALRDAKLVAWIGPSYEAPLYKHLKHLGEKALTLQFCPNVKLRPVRSGALWESHCHDHDDHGHDHDDHGHKRDDHGHTHASSSDEAEFAALDGHVWLDPDYMIAMTENLAAALLEIYPNHRQAITENARAYKERLRELKETLREKTRPYLGAEYVTRHDGTAYFDAAFGTRAVATLTIDPSIPVSAASILKIHRAMADKVISPVCFFSEPRFNEALVEGYAARLGLPVASFDYLGNEVAPGFDAYEKLMVNFTDDLIAGFSKKIKG